MTWPDFLIEIKHQNQVALFGPMMDRPRPLVMPTVMVDGGANFVAGMPEKHPSVRVGDGDSVASSQTLDHLLPAQKDFSDLAFVLRGLPLSVRGLEMFGFLGGRRDHELANFGEVHAFLTARLAADPKANCVVHFHDAQGIRVIALGGGQLELRIDGLFSVMALARANVRISGDCEYKSEGLVTLEPFSSLGLSNVGHGQVRVACASPVFLLLN